MPDVEITNNIQRKQFALMEAPMITPAIEQEITDACTGMEMVREAAKRNDAAMMGTALKDVRKRVNRLLRTIETASRAPVIDPTLPQEPALPIKG
jgi:hypothetical protein